MSSFFIVLKFLTCSLDVSNFVVSMFTVIFSSPLRVTATSNVPLLVTTHPHQASRSEEIHTRSAQHLVAVEPLLGTQYEHPLFRLFPYPDFSDEQSPSTPPPCKASCLSGSGSSIFDDSPSLLVILFEICSGAKPKLLYRLRSFFSVGHVAVNSLKMNFRSVNIDDVELHFQTSSTRNPQLEPDVSNPALRALFSLQLVHGHKRVLFEERSVPNLVNFRYAANRSLEDRFLNVKVLLVIGLGDVQFSPSHKSMIRLSGRHALRLPPHTIIIPACLASRLIYPPSPLQTTLVPVAPFLRLLLVVFDCFIEPKTVTISLLPVIALFDVPEEYSRTGVYGSNLLDQASFVKCISLLCDQARKRTSTFHTCPKYAP